MHFATYLHSVANATAIWLISKLIQINIKPVNVLGDESMRKQSDQSHRKNSKYKIKLRTNINHVASMTLLVPPPPES